MLLNRWVYMCFGIVFFVGLLALRNYLVMQTAGFAETEPAPSASTFQSNSVPPNTTSSLPAATGNSSPQSAPVTDPTTQQHTLETGGRADIEQIGTITVSQQQAYPGDDITFTITLKNTASYKKFVRQLCWESTEGNFGCSPGFNLDSGQVFQISNNGRFAARGTKSVWVMWTQDSSNFYTPVDNMPVRVQIL